MGVWNSNVNDIETKAETLRYGSLLSEQKQNVFIWSAFDQDIKKMFLMVPKSFLSKADRFRFSPKILGGSKTI